MNRCRPESKILSLKLLLEQEVGIYIDFYGSVLHPVILFFHILVVESAVTAITSALAPLVRNETLTAPSSILALPAPALVTTPVGSNGPANTEAQTEPALLETPTATASVEASQGQPVFSEPEPQQGEQQATAAAEEEQAMLRDVVETCKFILYCFLHILLRLDPDVSFLDTSCNACSKLFFSSIRRCPCGP